MSNVVVYMSMPVDGFIAGPSDDLELRRRAGVGRPSVGRSRVERLARSWGTAPRRDKFYPGASVNPSTADGRLRRDARDKRIR